MKLSRTEALLKCFKLGREALSAKFTNEDPELYILMFRHEPSPAEMNLSISKFFFEWATSHPSIFEEENSLDQNSPETKLSSEFIEAYKSFINLYISETSEKDPQTSDALLHLSKDYIESMRTMLKASSSDKERIQKLRYQHEKSIKLFDRDMRKLMENKSDLV